MFDQMLYSKVVLMQPNYYGLTEFWYLSLPDWLSETTAGILTYEEAEWRRAGWEGCEKLQNAEAWVSHIQVVICGALFTAELLQSPPLHTVPCMLHQRSQKCLPGEEREKVCNVTWNCSAPLSAVMVMVSWFRYLQYKYCRYLNQVPTIKKKSKLLHFLTLQQHKLCKYCAKAV